MVPGVGNHSLRCHPAPRKHRITVQHLFHDDGHHGGNQSHHARLFERLPLRIRINGSRPVPTYPRPDSQQRDAYQCRGKRLVLAVPVIIILVPGPVGEAHKKKHDHIRHEIRQRMHRIRNHRGTMSRHARDEFKHQEQEIPHTPDNRHPVYLALAFPIFHSSLSHIVGQRHGLPKNWEEWLS